MTTATEMLLDGLDAITRAPLPAPQAHAARLRLLDYLGCAFAGAALEQDRLEALAASLTGIEKGSNSGNASLIGLGRRAPASIAALVNGVSSHTAELDDGNRFGMVHPGVPVISAVLAQVQAQGLGEDALLRGIVLGYEATVRLARTIQPRAKDGGLHATGVCGAVGAAVGVAAALRLDARGMNAALAGGATTASGLLQVIRGTSQLKPFNAGQAAQGGLAAALMAQAGFAGPRDVLGGEHGYLHVMTGDPNVDPTPLKGTGTPSVQDVYVKPYASCRHCHAPVEAALNLRAAHGLTPEQIARVEVRSHRMAVHLHDHTEIHGAHSAKMSVNYCVAAALATGEAGMAAFNAARVADAGILDLTRRVAVTADPALTALVPVKRAAEVDIYRHNGAMLHARIDLPKGEPETALSEAELVEKFTDLALFAGLKRAEADRLAAQVMEGAGLEALARL